MQLPWEGHAHSYESNLKKGFGFMPRALADATRGAASDAPHACAHRGTLPSAAATPTTCAAGIFAAAAAATAPSSLPLAAAEASAVASALTYAARRGSIAG